MRKILTFGFDEKGVQEFSEFVTALDSGNVGVVFEGPPYIPVKNEGDPDEWRAICHPVLIAMP